MSLIKILSVIIFLLSTSICEAQLKEYISGEIGIACDFSGQPTPSVNRMVTLLKGSNFSSIEKYLDSRTIANRVLSVMVLEILEERGDRKLSKKTKQKILEIYNLDHEVNLCSGCTYYESISAKDFLDRKKKNIMREEIENWILRQQKSKEN